MIRRVVIIALACAFAASTFASPLRAHGAPSAPLLGFSAASAQAERDR